MLEDEQKDIAEMTQNLRRFNSRLDSLNGVNNRSKRNLFAEKSNGFNPV